MFQETTQEMAETQGNSRPKQRPRQLGSIVIPPRARKGGGREDRKENDSASASETAEEEEESAGQQLLHLSLCVGKKVPAPSELGWR